MPSNLISIRDDASFKEFANLKVPNRRDRQFDQSQFTNWLDTGLRRIRHQLFS